MKLSLRLENIASMIPLHKDVIDVGCDHGLLDIYLSKTRKDIQILGTDISEESIVSAKENAEKYEAQKTVVFAVRDGLKGVDVKDEVIVLSGMGSHTILSILDSVELHGNTLITSSQKNIDLLRRKMVERGYYIAEEKAVFDKKWYVIIRFEQGVQIYSDIDYSLGPYTKHNKEYIAYLYEKEKYISTRKKEKTNLLKILEKI